MDDAPALTGPSLGERLLSSVLYEALRKAAGAFAFANSIAEPVIARGRNSIGAAFDPDEWADFQATRAVVEAAIAQAERLSTAPFEPIGPVAARVVAGLETKES